MDKLILNDNMATEWWVDYLTGELEDEKSSELSQYLRSHPELQEELKASEEVWLDLEKIPRPAPSGAMDSKFEAMLDGYRAANERNSAINWLPILQDWLSRSWRVGFAALVIGLLLGWLLVPNARQDTQMADLNSEVQEMKKMMMLTLIDQPKAQERIRAVNMAGELSSSDVKVIQVLAETLNSDENINVRLAALQSMVKYWEFSEARSELVKSISMQDSPLIQTAIADAMLALREKKAIGEFEKLLAKPELNEGVKEKLELTVQKLRQI